MHEPPTKYLFRNQTPSTSLKHLVWTAKNRWWIEHSDPELKAELGLDHFEDRFWQGWHLQVVLVLLGDAFLQALRRQHPKNGGLADPTAASKIPAAIHRDLSMRSVC